MSEVDSAQFVKAIEQSGIPAGHVVLEPGQQISVGEVLRVEVAKVAPKPEIPEHTVVSQRVADNIELMIWPERHVELKKERLRKRLMREAETDGHTNSRG